MVTSLSEHPATHPLAGLVGDLERLLDDTGEAPAWTLTPGDLTELLPRLAQARNRLAAVELRMLREADRHQVGDPVGAANTAAWWANSTNIDKPSAHRQVALAAELDEDAHAPTLAALTSGEISVDQAAVIVDAVKALPGELVDPALRLDAERHLIGLAAHHGPRRLRILGRKVLDVLAPEVAEDQERRVLEAQEQHAAATATFSMRSDGRGSVYGRFKVPALAGAMLAKHLDAIAAPKHRAARDGTAGERVSRRLRLGQAFIEYVETRTGSDIPRAGGVAATVVVTMTMENLLGTGERAAMLDTGDWISASEARRLACEAGIIPAVLGTPSQPLDLGRKTRFHTETQRHALALRDRGCKADGCDWPPAMCHAHHGIPWSHGGHTNVRDGMLLCPRHHTLAHDRRYQLKTDKHGKVTFTRRT